jgi:hypothetical protein
MANTKNITTKKSKDFTAVKRAGYIFLFSGSVATSAYLGILVSTPDTGQLALAGFNLISATYFFTKAIK